ncbi:hypothetical protein E2562_002628 [Oryza meyeriana var. granulata]|uniref:Uncharacterized protein n=1 Tax=Oryza meyeriana var. granulata TaxID=110450 RepID=A0A6G1F324_9ORYZ|nr:hypothetical protein E2562_002628 [Oryza meyeriana var. granulata]
MCGGSGAPWPLGSLALWQQLRRAAGQLWANDGAGDLVGDDAGHASAYVFVSDFGQSLPAERRDRARRQLPVVRFGL